MLSSIVVSKFGKLLAQATKFYQLPSIWSAEKGAFVAPSKLHTRIYNVVGFVELLFRIWMYGAYGYMLVMYVQEPSTIMKAAPPLAYLCVETSVFVCRVSSHLYETEMNTFMNSYLRLNEYLVKELGVDETVMPKQRLMNGIMSAMKRISLLMPAVGGTIWLVNYNGCNGYIYFFGNNAGVWIYDAFVYLFFYVNWIIWLLYGAFNIIYFLSTYEWLQEFLRRRVREELPFERLVHFYRCIYFANMLHSRAFSEFFFPVILVVTQFTLIYVVACVILFSSRLGFLTVFILSSLIFTQCSLIVTLTKASSVFINIGGIVLNELRNDSNSRITRNEKIRILKPLREVRVSVGTFYFIDPGTLLVTLDIIVGNVINVVLTYK